MNNVRHLWGLIGGLLLLLAVVGWSWYKEADDLQTVAVVGDTGITEAEWLAELKRRHGRQVLEEMINRQVVEQQAKKLGITVDPKRVDAEVERIRESYVREQDFPSSLKQGGGIDWETLRRDVEYQLLLQAIATAEVAVPEEEIRRYFEEHRDDFALPARARVWQIVVATREEAGEVLQELEAGANFATLAKERSIDTYSASSGGDLGWVSLEGDELPDAVREAAAVLPLEEVSQPLAVENGYAVIRVTERKEAVDPTYEDVKEQIRQELALAQVSLDDVLIRLRESAGVQGMGESQN